MRGDEARIVAAFERWLVAQGWSVQREVDFVDLVAEAGGDRLYVEAKGRTQAIGLDVDTMYGQILRRMPLAEDACARFAVVVPSEAVRAALRVPERVREMLRIDVYAVDEGDGVTGPLAGEVEAPARAPARRAIADLAAELPPRRLAPAPSGEVVVFRGDDGGYLAWVNQHPGGFVINAERSLNPNTMKLHAASCQHVSSTTRPPGAWTERDYIKICAGTASVLTDVEDGDGDAVLGGDVGGERPNDRSPDGCSGCWGW